MYWIFRDATHNLAFAHELQHRIPDRDPRRMAFSRQIELMSRIGEAFSARLHEEIAELLERAPYDDAAVSRLSRQREGDP